MLQKQLYLELKVAVFSNRPSIIKKEFRNDFPRPRTAEDESLKKISTRCFNRT